MNKKYFGNLDFNKIHKQMLMKKPVDKKKSVDKFIKLLNIQNKNE